MKSNQNYIFMLKKIKFILLFCLLSVYTYSQNITQVNYNVSGGTTTSYDNPGTILFPTGYTTNNSKTPVIFVHGITGKLSGSYDANIDQVKNYQLNAAFVQLEPLGSTIDNGKLLSKMINYVRWHYDAETVSIVAHSKGGMDTERALYGQNAYTSSNLPTFSYEKVDGVYTFSSPVRGARVADVGSTLSWFSGVVWATMWYTNGWSLTSGNVNGFHNWAKGWRINSTSTFKNAYNPNGASYNRLNMSEDNTTRWWAHQSDDECYDDVWYYCYIGRPFQSSVGAYIDAYWEWDWLDSGWRNWHDNSDGFISEYRAKRIANQNANPSLTPGSGDSNYRTMHDANHSSLWEKGENHFSREAAPYLHYGLYGNRNISNSNSTDIKENPKDEVKASNSSILASNGNLYYGKNGNTNFIVEENNKHINFIIYGNEKLDSFTLINKDTNETILINIDNSQKDKFSSAIVSVANSSELKKGNYILKTASKDFLVIANNEDTSTAFAAKLNFNEKIGYNGENIQVGIANKDNAINFNNINVTADLSMVALSQDTPLDINKVVRNHFILKPSSKKGYYNIDFKNLKPGAIYSLRIVAKSNKGEVLLSRNIINTFFVKKKIEEQLISVKLDNKPKNSIEINQIDLYPNPARNNITITNIAKNSINTIEIINNKGNLIKTIKPNKHSVNIDLKENNLPKGLYLLKIYTNNNTTIKKLVIE